MARKGLALKSELAMIIGCRILSSLLACRISAIPRIWGGDIQCVFSLGLGRRCAFSFPDRINPVFGVFAGGLEGSFFVGSTRVFLASVFSSGSIVAIANCMSDRAPLASSSLAFRFSRLACDLEHG